MAVTSKPTANKTSINFSNFAGRGGGSGVSKPNQFASIGQAASNNIKQIDSTIALEGDVSELSVRLKNVEVTNDALVSQNREFQTSLASIQQRVGALESGQKAILEFQKDKDKIEKKQRKLEEQRLKREGAESSLEDDGTKKDIEEKDPKTKKAAKGAMGILDRIKQFFTFVVAGWFTDKTFKLIEAFQTGNKEMINKIGLKLLAGTAAVAGIFSMALFGIGPVLGAIGSLIATLAGLLFNPITLTALLIAVGIGGAVMGIRALFKWGEKKATGGGKFLERHKELDQKLLDAGMNKRGMVRSGQGGAKRPKDPEKLKIWEEVKAEREKLHDLKKKMNAEMEQVVKDTPKSGFKKRTSVRGSNRTWHTSEDLEIIKNKQDEIRSKYESQIGGGVSGDGSNVSAGGKTDFFPEYGPADTGEGNVTVIPNPVLEETSTVQKGKKKGVEHLSSDNSDNLLTLNTQVQLGVVV